MLGTAKSRKLHRAGDTAEFKLKLGMKWPSQLEPTYLGDNWYTGKVWLKVPGSNSDFATY